MPTREDVVGRSEGPHRYCEPDRPRDQKHDQEEAPGDGPAREPSLDRLIRLLGIVPRSRMTRRTFRCGCSIDIPHVVQPARWRYVGRTIEQPIHVGIAWAEFQILPRPG